MWGEDRDGLAVELAADDAAERFGGFLHADLQGADGDVTHPMAMTAYRPFVPNRIRRQILKKPTRKLGPEKRLRATTSHFRTKTAPLDVQPVLQAVPFQGARVSPTRLM